MKITEHEMRGLLAGKCLPGDMRVNEDLPTYLVRKFDELQQKLDELVGLVENVDNSHCMCGAAIDKKYGCGCGHTVGMFDYHYGKWSEQLRSGTHETADKAG